MQANDLGFAITNEEISYVVMIGPLGYLIGCPLSGFLLDKIGRKNTLLFMSVPEILPWILIATSTCVPMLYIARLITGIADGALFTALPVYIGEIAEPKVRGVLGTSHSMGILIGMLLINTYGSYLSIRTAAYVSLAVPFLFLVTFVWMPDSPYYFLMKGRTQEARKSLQILRKMNNVDVELSRITADVRRQISEPGTMRDVFTNKTNLKALSILMGLRTFQQFSGLTALGYYSQMIFKQAAGSLSPAESTIICNVIQIVFTCCSAAVVDRFGRKPVFMASSLGSAVALISMGLYFCLMKQGYDMSFFGWLPMVEMVLYYIAYASGLLIIPNVMTGEVLSVSVKSKALGLINIYLGLCMAVTSKLFQSLDQNVGMHAPFFVFGACCTISCVFCYFAMPETKGKTLEEIQQLLMGNHKTVLSDAEPCNIKDPAVTSKLLT